MTGGGRSYGGRFHPEAGSELTKAGKGDMLKPVKGKDGRTGLMRIRN